MVEGYFNRRTRDGSYMTSLLRLSPTISLVPPSALLPTAGTMAKDDNEKRPQTRDGSDSFEDRGSARGARDDILPMGSVDPVYQAKAELLNAAIQEIGMGKYQVSALHT